MGGVGVRGEGEGGMLGKWGSGKEASSNKHFTEGLLSSLGIGNVEQQCGGLSRSTLELTMAGTTG